MCGSLGPSISRSIRTPIPPISILLELPVPATQLARKDIKLSPGAAAEVQDSDVSPCLMKLVLH